MTSICPADPEDAEQILGIQKRAFDAEARLVRNWDIPPMADTVDAVVEHIRSGRVLKAIDGRRIVGSIRGVQNGTVCDIQRLSVEPEYRGRGLGSALLAAIEQAFPEATGFELVTNDAVKENVRFYVRHGYHVHAKVRHSESITLVHMRKRVGVADV